MCIGRGVVDAPDPDSFVATRRDRFGVRDRGLKPTATVRDRYAVVKLQCQRLCCAASRGHGFRILFQFGWLLLKKTKHIRNGEIAQRHEVERDDGGEEAAVAHRD